MDHGFDNQSGQGEQLSVSERAASVMRMWELLEKSGSVDGLISEWQNNILQVQGSARKRLTEVGVADPILVATMLTDYDDFHHDTEFVIPEADLLREGSDDAADMFIRISTSFDQPVGEAGEVDSILRFKEYCAEINPQGDLKFFRAVFFDRTVEQSPALFLPRKEWDKDMKVTDLLGGPAALYRTGKAEVKTAPVTEKMRELYLLYPPQKP